jgi:uncharacterized GH25 family protein
MIIPSKRTLMIVMLVLSSLVLSFNAFAHDRWLLSPKLDAKPNDIVPLELGCGHGFESEAIPSEWWLAKFAVLNPEGGMEEVSFAKKEKTGYGEFKAEKEGTYLAYSMAEKIFWAKTTDGYKQFKDKLEIEKALLQRVYVGWEYAKTFIKVGSSKGDAFQKVVGGLLELVPQKDPTSLRVGDLLPLKILSQGEVPKWDIAITAVYQGFPGEKWSYSYYTEFFGKKFSKKENEIKIPVTHKGWWFVKALRMPDRQLLCEKEFGDYDETFIETSITFYVP